jgi:HEXXH motif-containing protein
VAYLLLRHGTSAEADSQRFAELLLAELAAIGSVPQLPRSLWTARGDRFLTPENVQGPDKTGLGDTGIALDERSPFSFSDDEFGLAGTLALDEASCAAVKDKLLSAFGILQMLSDRIYSFVTTFIEVLAIRQHLEQPNVFYSSTFSRYIGLVRFTNAHRPNANMPTLVEALVHEAIHGLLYMCEELAPAFSVKQEAERISLNSPWTGATISLHSYMHACAVWYGIYWFWSEVLRARVDGMELCEASRDIAHAGFKHRPVSKGLASFEHLLPSGMNNLLRELEARMLAMERGS